MNRNVTLVLVVLALIVSAGCSSDKDTRVKKLEAQGFIDVEFFPGSNEFEAYTSSGELIHGTVALDATSISSGPLPHATRGILGLGRLRPIQ
ncbi:MAG: hypothetical protein Q8M09_08110 [Pseudomonadota bacterium]|nr:hypothetical protein [Pseudomonadota bacterium]MDP1904192.1 hypothetical protein [Pseudomonadota bacterium]